MKGFLKGSDGGVFHLLPKLTTIGRDGCNLAIQVFVVRILTLAVFVRHVF